MFRKVDPLGRIVLPIELRRTLQIDVKDEVEIFVEGEQICLIKYQHQCVICGNKTNLKEYKGKKICSACIELLKKSST